jgi:hypothetical protein
MQLELTGEVYEWRGPAPYHFVDVPEDGCAAIDDARALVTYGWGMVPVTVTMGATTWTTSLWPRGRRYVVPLKVAARRAEGVGLGDEVALRLDIAL